MLEIFMHSARESVSRVLLEKIMEAFQAVLQSKTHNQLQKLDEKLKRDCQHQDKVTEKQRELETLRSRIEELNKRKKELEERLRHRPTDTLKAKLLENVKVGDFSAFGLPPEMQEKLMVKAAKHEEMNQLEYVLVAHRCVGVTAQIVEKRCVRLRFETSYKGEYLEPFYLELEFKGDKMELSWHTIPVFVPLESLVEKYNRKEINLSALVRDVHAHLTALVRRRQQAVEFTSKFTEYLSHGDIASSGSFNTIQLVLNIPVDEGKSVTELIVQLYYKDLRSELPSKVRCNNPERLPVDKVKIKQAFLSLPVAEAFQNLFLDQNIEQG